MAPRRARALPLTLALLAVVFAALGAWQLERRTEKRALIAAVEDRAHRPPVAAPSPDDWPALTARKDSYRAIAARGMFLPVRPALVQAVTDYGPGFWVLAPLRTDEGWRLLVNRGFIPADRRDRPPPAPAGEVTLTGLLRLTEPGGGFLHANDPAADRWYSRDVAAIGRARGIAPVAPYFLDAGPSADPAQPIGGLTVIAFANNHLQYALTWFAFAALAATGAARARRKRS